MSGPFFQCLVDGRRDVLKKQEILEAVEQGAEVAVYDKKKLIFRTKKEVQQWINKSL